jgi:hypothetical protein
MKRMLFIVLTHDKKPIDWSLQRDALILEAKAVWNLNKTGELRDIWFTKNKDAVLLIEAHNEKSVIAIMDQLPLVKEDLIDYTIIELQPYTGYERLFHGTD